MGGVHTNSSKIGFGTDGWRGIISDTFTFNNVQVVAQAIADYVNDDTNQAEKGLVIGYDTRFLSRQYAEECAKVIAGNGIKVFLADKVSPTPAVSYMVNYLSAGGGIMVTASHNPPEYNGIKFKAPYGGSASPEIMEKIEGFLFAQPIKKVSLSHGKDTGLIEYCDIDSPYLAQIRSIINFDIIKNSGFKVLVDPMFGAGSGYIKSLLEGCGLEVVEIRGENNPGFGGICPEPIEKNLGALAKSILEYQADIGLATDGDADRVGAMDDQGLFVNSHQIYALFLKHLIERRKWTGGVVKTFSTTRMIELLGKKYDLPIYETPIGFKYICDLFIKKDILIGGEESGGIAIKNHIPERDGILSSLLLLEIMAFHGKNLRGILQELKEEIGEYCYDRVDIHCCHEKKEEIFTSLCSHPPKSFGGYDVTKVETLDGVKLNLANGSWVLFRASGTEPVVRVYVESGSKDMLISLLEEGTRRVVNI